MKNFKYLLIIIFSISLLTSCDDELESDLYDKGPNLASFEQKSRSFSVLSDGQEYSFELQMKVVGPTLTDLTSDVTVTIGVDESSTAVEGTHFRLDQNQITLSANNNFLGLIPFTMLTNGIEAPSSPVVVLKVTQASGNVNVIASGKPLSVTLNYGCHSTLEGTYDLLLERDNGPDVFFPGEKIIRVGVGEYKTESTYRWAVGAIAPDQGFNFTDVCGEITVPLQDLAQGTFSNDVQGSEPGFVDPVTGDLVIHYSVEFDSGPVICKGTYTKL